MPYEPINAVRVGDIVLNEDTGEVLEFGPEAGATDRATYLAHRLVESQRAIKSWEDAFRVLKIAAGRVLADAGLGSLQTPAGTLAYRQRATETGRPERVPDIAQNFELSPRQVELVMECATALDAKKLRALGQVGAIPMEAAEFLIERKTAEWVEVRAPRPAPPRVERLQVEVEE